MRVPPAETPTLFARRGPGGKIVVEAIQDGSGYDCDGEALKGKSSSRKAKDFSILRCDGEPNELASAATSGSHGYWRPIIAEVVEKYLAYGTLKHGFARVRCGACKHEYLLATVRLAIETSREASCSGPGYT